MPWRFPVPRSGRTWAAQLTAGSVSAHAVQLETGVVASESRGFPQLARFGTPVADRPVDFRTSGNRKRRGSFIHLSDGGILRTSVCTGWFEDNAVWLLRQMHRKTRRRRSGPWGSWSNGAARLSASRWMLSTARLRGDRPTGKPTPATALRSEVSGKAKERPASSFAFLRRSRVLAVRRAVLQASSRTVSP